MKRLEQKHIDFLRKCAGANTTQVPDEPIDKADLDQMVKEGLLIEYRGIETRYTVTQNGSRFARDFGASPELEKIAIEYVKSKGYSQEAAEKIVKENGAEVILKSKQQEDGPTEGQRGLRVPTDDMGKPAMKFYKP